MCGSNAHKRGDSPPKTHKRRVRADGRPFSSEPAFGRVLGRLLLGVAFTHGYRPYIKMAQTSGFWRMGLRAPEAMPINAGTLLLKADKEGFERAAVR
jgi:hypothetical protein